MYSGVVKSKFFHSEGGRGIDFMAEATLFSGVCRKVVLTFFCLRKSVKLFHHVRRSFARWVMLRSFSRSNQVTNNQRTLWMASYQPSRRVGVIFPKGIDSVGMIFLLPNL